MAYSLHSRKQQKSSTDSTQHLRISSLAPSPWDSGGVVPKVLPTERSCAGFSTAAVNEHGYHGLVVQCQYHGQVLGLLWQCYGPGGGGLEMGETVRHDWWIGWCWKMVAKLGTDLRISIDSGELPITSGAVVACYKCSTSQHCNCLILPKVPVPN